MTFTLPIFTGTISSTASEGTIETLGSIALVQIGGGASVSSDPAARTVGETNATVSMGANLARAFNEAFAKPLGKPRVFAAGEPLGTVSFVAQAE